ncbi:hypothetical protein Csa_023593, partial [Cucumis sativus]
ISNGCSVGHKNSTLYRSQFDACQKISETMDAS